MTRRTALRTLVAAGALAWYEKETGVGGVGMPPSAQGRGPVVKALVFDAYGTLFDTNSVVARLETHFPGRGADISRVWRAKQLEYTWLVSLMGRYEDFWAVTEKALQFACVSLQIMCTPAQRADLLNAYLELAVYPDVRDGLTRLGALPLSILSNGTPAMLAAVVRANGLANAFAHVISVDEVRTFKPSPTVYALAPARLGLDKAEIGFVSSNGFDALGAKAFGFRTFWINRVGSAPEQLGFAADRTITSFGELAAALAG